MNNEKEEKTIIGMETIGENCAMPGDPLDEEQQRAFRKLYEPVSYTHLDVYKRQILATPMPSAV